MLSLASVSLVAWVPQVTWDRSYNFNVPWGAYEKFDSGRFRYAVQLRHCRRRMRKVQSYSPGCANVHPYLIDGSMDPPDSASQTASRLVQLFLQSSRQIVPILYTVPPFLPHNCPLSIWGSGPSSNTWFLGCT